MPVSMMVPPKVRRSTVAAHSRGSVKVFVHPAELSCEAIATLAFSCRSVKTWNSTRLLERGRPGLVDERTEAVRAELSQSGLAGLSPPHILPLSLLKGDA